MTKQKTAYSKNLRACLHKQWITYHAGPLGNPSGRSPSSWL